MFLSVKLYKKITFPGFSEKGELEKRPLFGLNEYGSEKLQFS